MLNTAEFWVLVATIIFVILLGYMGVFGSLIEAIDGRRLKIEAELDEARRLKQEAADLVAEYQRKRGEAETEAAAMLAQARAEADRYAEEAKTRMDEFVQRRTKMAEGKIAQAEAQALADVRAAAADAAVAAAGDILSQSAKGKVADDLLTRGIADVRAKLN
jgi:F-type H+-transporting ATPase subunit b